MTDNQRLFKAFEFLKKKGFMKTYLHLAETLNMDEVELKELKKERKLYHRTNTNYGQKLPRNFLNLADSRRRRTL